MTSPIEICNQALAAVGTRTTIASLDEGSNESIQCNLQYNSTVDTVLRSAQWGFARRVVTAALLKTATGASPWTSDQPPPPWRYQYAYPSDCIMLRYVTGQEWAGTGTPIFSSDYQYDTTPAQPAKWAKMLDVVDGVESQTICTNAPLAIFCYTRRIEDPSQFDSLAVQALINGLASQICFALTGDKALAKGLAEQANNTILQARLADANEGVTVVDNVPDWLAIRGVPSVGLPAFAPEYGPLFEVK